MSQPTLSLGMWISLPNEVRYRIRVLFNVPKSKSTEVDDGKLVSDGTTHEDLMVINMDKMRGYVHSDSNNFYELFDLLVAKVNDELYPKSVTPSSTITISNDDSLTVIIEPKKRGRPAKKQ